MIAALPLCVPAPACLVYCLWGVSVAGVGQGERRMEGQKHHSGDDDLQVEVSDLRQDTGAATPASPARSPFAPRRTPR
jgi:hypothetical protein